MKGNIDVKTSLFSGLSDIVVAVKSADQGVTNDNSYVSDADLVIPVGSGEKWLIETLLYFTASVNPDVKWKYVIPAAATIKGISQWSDSGVYDVTDASAEVGANTSGNPLVVHTRALYFGGVNAGNVVMNWGAINLTGDTLTLKEGSVIIATRLP